jgi:hypothetical protein
MTGDKTSSDQQPKDHSHVLKGHCRLAARKVEGVSLRPPPIHHHRDGGGIEHGHAMMNDVGDSQQVGPLWALIRRVAKNLQLK